MEQKKRREIEKKVFFGLYTLLPIVSALYFFVDAIITGDWSKPRTYLAFATCVLFVLGVFCVMAIPVVRVSVQKCQPIEDKLVKASVILIAVGAVCRLLTHLIFGWS